MIKTSSAYLLGPQLSPSKPQLKQLKPIVSTKNDGVSVISGEIDSPYIPSSPISRSRPVSAHTTNQFFGKKSKNNQVGSSLSLATTIDCPSSQFPTRVNTTRRRPASSYSGVTRRSKDQKLNARDFAFSQEFSSIFNPVNDDEKPEWLVASKSGTIYEDERTRLSEREIAKEKLRPKIIKELQKCYQQAAKDETQKQEQRLRILYRFRLQRLRNTYIQEQNHQLQNKPIIFTPDMDNPYNPDAIQVQKYTESDSYMNKLSEPKFKIAINAPECYDENDPETYRMLKQIKALKDIRLKYHWKSFYYRPTIENINHHHQYFNDTIQTNTNTINGDDSISTCSTASIATDNIYTQKQRLTHQEFYQTLIKKNNQKNKKLTSKKTNTINKKIDKLKEKHKVLLKSHNPFEKHKFENYIQKTKQRYTDRRVTCLQELDTFDEKLTYLFGKQSSVSRRHTEV